MNISRLIASVFGIGYLPYLPGTFGSLAGLLAYVFFLHAMGASFIFWILGLMVVGLIASQNALKGQMLQDPSWIVVDETLGMFVSYYLIPLRWPYLLLGFCLFRFFDITKLFPINRLEHLPGAWGILFDDLGAGLYTNLLLQIFLRLAS